VQSILSDKALTKVESIYGRDLKIYQHAHKNLNEVLKHSVDRFPEREMLVFEDRRITYKEFYQLVTKAAANLQQRFQFKKGDRLAILSNNTIEFCISVFAASFLGGIVVPLNTRLRPAELQFMLKNSGTNVLIVEDVFADLAEESIQLADIDIQVFVTGKQKKQSLLWNPFDCLLEENQPAVSPEVKTTDPLFIMYTSGTTGTPKGALGTHLGITQNVLNFSLNLVTDERDRTLINIPLFHVSGLIAGFSHMVSVGGTSVLMNTYKTKRFLELLDREKITYINTVPTIFVFILNYPERAQYDLSHLRLAVTGGAPMAVSTINQLTSLYPNMNFINNYGATECTGSCTFSKPESAFTKPDSVGMLTKIIDWKIVNEYGEEVARNEVGELCIKGPTVIPEYWNNPEATSREFVDNGYWKSGDMGYVDEEGCFFLLDRKKSMINRGGENIYTAEIENVLFNHPSVLEAAVVGLPDEVFGEEVLASVVLKEGHSLDAEQVRSFVGEYLADFKVPKYVQFLDELPRNPSGKVLKAPLKEGFKKTSVKDR
jgi:long-chain acyl-CoA synthetase